jgi:hypothetical protein
MRLALGVSLLVVAACASSGSTSSTAARPATETIRIQGAGALSTAASGPSTSARTLAAPIDRAWRALPAVYDSLGIAVATVDAASHTIGNPALKARFRLGKTSLSRYLDCGDTQMGPSADSYEVTINVTTRLTAPEAASTAVETSLEATARPVQFAQAPSRCSSKNVLEPRVADMLAKLLGAAPQR